MTKNSPVLIEIVLLDVLGNERPVCIARDATLGRLVELCNEADIFLTAVTEEDIVLVDGDNREDFTDKEFRDVLTTPIVSGGEYRFNKEFDL
jgi:hypothetical protein